MNQQAEGYFASLSTDDYNYGRIWYFAHDIRSPLLARSQVSLFSTDPVGCSTERQYKYSRARQVIERFYKFNEIKKSIGEMKDMSCRQFDYKQYGQSSLVSIDPFS